MAIKMSSSPKVEGPEGKASNSIKNFVQNLGGTTPIKSVLIANNGIAAVKCIRSIRKWCYEVFGDERAVKFVVMATPEDIEVNSEYIKMADSYVRVPGASNCNNYANVKIILDIAQKSKVQAVWAGWGHASENPKLPELLKGHGIIFIGPPASAMASLGDKIASTIVAQSAGVPTLPWSGSGVTIPLNTNSSSVEQPFTIPEEVYMRGAVSSVTEGLASARRIGFPVMIKASEGGGGKGIRLVANEDDFKSLFEQVQLEVPGSPLFVMQLAKRSRHLEVQLLADHYGSAIALFGRDCSVQRRHQKIIEEAPATAAPREIFHQMEKAAVRLATLVGYVSAGTVEYLFDEVTSNFYFLELNPRLQVEHPCTEMVSDVNLPAAQLQIAMGIPLHRMKDVRLLYNEHPCGVGPIDFDDISRRKLPHGHVIATRITAENPDEGFKPSNGSMAELNFRSSTNVWGYFSVTASGGLHEYADSQFGHVFAWGEDRERARQYSSYFFQSDRLLIGINGRNLVVALKEISIRGDFRTIVEYLIKLLETDDFINNQIDTGWLDELIRKKIKADKPDKMTAVVCTAVHMASLRLKARVESFSRSLEKGQIGDYNLLSTTIQEEIIYESERFKFQVSAMGPTVYIVALAGRDEYLELELQRLNDGGSLILLNNQSHILYMNDEVDKYRIVLDGKTALFLKDNDPSVVRVNSQGKLMRYLVPDVIIAFDQILVGELGPIRALGSRVKAGQSFAEFEVMKMIIPLISEESGILRYSLPAGSILKNGDIVAKLLLDDPASKKTVTTYSGRLPGYTSSLEGSKIHEIKNNRYTALRYVMDGYSCPEPLFSKYIFETFHELVKALNDPALPLLEIQEALSSLDGRVPANVEVTINAVLADYANSIGSVFATFPTQAVASALDRHASTLRKGEDDQFFATFTPLIQHILKYRNGIEGHCKTTLLELVEQYFCIERLFCQETFEDGLIKLRKHERSEVDKLVKIAQSHWNVANKNVIVLKILDYLCGSDGAFLLEEDRNLLKQLASLTQKENSLVAAKARKILIQSTMPSFQRRYLDMKLYLQAAVESTGQSSLKAMQLLVNQSGAVMDTLTAFFGHEDSAIRLAALEVYVRRAYRAYSLQALQNIVINGCNLVQWNFFFPPNHPELSLGTIDSLNEEVLSESIGGARQQCCEKTTREYGFMVAFEQLEQASEHMPVILEHLMGYSNSEESFFCPQRNLLYVTLTAIPRAKDMEDPELLALLTPFVQLFIETFAQKSVRRITFIVVCQKMFPKIFSFRAHLHYCEDAIYRHIEPALAFELELYRMRNYTNHYVPTSNKNIHLYFSESKEGSGLPSAHDRRFFIRSIIRHADLISKEASLEYFLSEGERQVVESLNELEVVFEDPRYYKTDCNHLFLNFVPVISLDLDPLLEVLKQLILRHGRRFWKNRVLQAEIKLVARLHSDEIATVLRLVVNNESGYDLRFYVYAERSDDGAGRTKFYSLNRRNVGPWEGKDVSSPYVTKTQLQRNRFIAQSNNTTYIRDFPELFMQAVRLQWQRSRPACAMPASFCEFTEYTLDDVNSLVETGSLPEPPLIGMVAYKLTFRTPEYPDGREVMLVGNDITHRIGSFGPREDLLFLKASELSRKLGIPRIYISVNSGARIGLAREVLEQFRVCWVDEKQPSKGFNYLYVTPAAYESLKGSNSILAEKLLENGEERYVITDVIGKEDGLGVENLHYSALTAGETSRAYDEVFTLSIVSCRSVGIGAYLVRLGQRVIQVEGSSIILTGSEALNKMLGSRVYLSNTQLGGTKIMYPNGVTHIVVPDDFAAVTKTVDWLSYIPDRRNAPLPMALPPTDPYYRPIDFTPTKAPYDPRHMIAGVVHPYNPDEFVHGMFDKGSWMETLGGWACTVVTGRARLGGIPVGVIAVETRSVEVMYPADPASPESEAKVVVQPGQVWFPDSSFKTAQTIRDVNNEQLPLIILANWRGFSGGMRDMHNEILKYGAQIVDSLKDFRQPVLVYIPPAGELRGGAWVVVDPAINPDMVEMYAAEGARGGILEPEGTVEIKFRRAEQRRKMMQLDSVYKELFLKKESLEKSPGGPENELEKCKSELTAREQEIGPIYHQVATHFADLHDTTSRMREKGVISRILEWKTSREYLYWRLRRRIHELEVYRRLKNANGTLAHGHVISMLRRWLVETTGDAGADLWNSNKLVVHWFSDFKDVIDRNITEVQRSLQEGLIESMCLEDKQLACQTIISLLKHVTPYQAEQISSVLSRLRAA